MERPTNSQPIIIIGAGIVGLTLAQALKKKSIPFQVYERDEALDHRAAGWGITIHWAMDALESCLPRELFAQIDDVQVDPEQGRQDTGRFVLLNLETLQPHYLIPPSPRKRISRSEFRALLTQGLDVHWGKTLSSFAPITNEDGNDEIVARFADGTEVRGALLVAADGSGSKTRTLLLGQEAGALHPLPVRFMGVTATLSEDEMAPLRAIDPLLFQGIHPETGYFFWFSVLSIPATNGSGSAREGSSEVQVGAPYYEAQIGLSWLVPRPEDEVPATDAEKLAMMRDMVRSGSGFHKLLRRVVEKIPDGTPVRGIKLADWLPTRWEGCDGRVTLLGDAAHPMTMYRGEAANHGFLDASKLAEQLTLWCNGSKARREALEDFEMEMRERTREAVLLSRQACLDAHDLATLAPDSPLVSKRAKAMEPGLRV